MNKHWEWTYCKKMKGFSLYYKILCNIFLVSLASLWGEKRECLQFLVFFFNSLYTMCVEKWIWAEESTSKMKKKYKRWMVSMIMAGTIMSLLQWIDKLNSTYAKYRVKSKIKQGFKEIHLQVVCRQK